MARWKKELRKHGFKLECDYPYMPYSMNGIALESISARIENNQIIYVSVFVVGIITDIIDRNFNVVKEDFD